MKNMLLEVSIVCCKTLTPPDVSIYDTLAVNMEMQIYKNNANSGDRLSLTHLYIDLLTISIHLQVANLV
jgi:hypothetical protein